MIPSHLINETVQVFLNIKPKRTQIYRNDFFFFTFKDLTALIAATDSESFSESLWCVGSLSLEGGRLFVFTTKPEKHQHDENISQFKKINTTHVCLIQSKLETNTAACYLYDFSLKWQNGQEILF